MPRGRGWFGGFGRGLGFWMTGLPGWARGWPRGYCWYYYQQTGQFPPWSPWSYWYGQGLQQQAQNQDITSQNVTIEQLEAIKKNLEEQLKTIENQIKELKKKGD